MEAQLHKFLTSALGEGEWSTWRTVRFTPGGGTQYPLNRRQGEPQSQGGRFGKYNNDGIPTPKLQSAA